VELELDDKNGFCYQNGKAGRYTPLKFLRSLETESLNLDNKIG
jgi:hypothetical protein